MDLGPFWFLDLPMQEWDNKVNQPVHAATTTPVALVNLPNLPLKLSPIQQWKHDDTGSPAAVWPQDTQSVTWRLLFPAPQGYFEAFWEVHPPPHSQCLHHLMLRGLFLPPGQFQAQAFRPGLGGCAHPSYWLTQRGKACFRTGDHTWTRRTWRAQTQVRTKKGVGLQIMLGEKRTDLFVN